MLCLKENSPQPAETISRAKNTDKTTQPGPVQVLMSAQRKCRARAATSYLANGRARLTASTCLKGHPKTRKTRTSLLPLSSHAPLDARQQQPREEMADHTQNQIRPAHVSADGRLAKNHWSTCTSLVPGGVVCANVTTEHAINSQAHIAVAPLARYFV
jgi:hypothetical protein